VHTFYASDLIIEISLPIFFVRHAQSVWNVSYESGDPDPMIFDPSLTEVGRLQAKDMKRDLIKLNLDLLISSPLTRALETTMISSPNSTDIKIWADHSELLSHSSDLGKPKSDLELLYPEYDFSCLREHWWYQGQKNENGIPVEPWIKMEMRMRKFEQRIKKLDKRSIAVIGHSKAFWPAPLRWSTF